MHSITAACSNSVAVLVALPPVPSGDDVMERILVGGGDGSVTVWVGECPNLTPYQMNSAPTAAIYSRP